MLGNYIHRLMRGGGGGGGGFYNAETEKITIL